MSIHAMANLLSSDGTTQKFAVGTTFEVKGIKYAYCKATAASIAAYSACSGANLGVMEEATTTTATALGTAGGPACIPQFAVAASEFFWAPIGGFGTLSFDGETTLKVLAANVTAGNTLLSTATDGVLDDATAGSTVPLINVALTETVTTQEAADLRLFGDLLWSVRDVA